MLLFANVAYFAWANWIAAPTVARTASPADALPRLKLASEAGFDTAGAAGQIGAPLTSPTLAAAAPPARCVSVGPFEDLGSVARAAATLQERGLETRQRAEQGTAWTGYWVYVGGLRNEHDQSRVLRRLEGSGIADAHVMPDSTNGRRVSVGLFSDRARAERRARAIEKLGIKPEIAERAQTGAAYWIDFDLAARDSAIAAEGLLSSNESGSRIEIRACPTAIERPKNAAPAGAAPREEPTLRLGMRAPPG